MIPVKGHASDLVESLLDEALAQPMAIPVLGLSGLPGSGKSTLARQLVEAAKRRGLAAQALCLDNFYLPLRERQVLARRVHPLLALRGPPGTHDPALALSCLDGLIGFRPGQALALPVFDKLRDRRLPPSRWRRVASAPRLVVFEGWCLGVPPEEEAALAPPVNDFERLHDADGRWRRHCNDALARYQPLWRRVDRLVLLQAPDFESAHGWRWQQEQSLRAGRPGLPGMSRDEVAAFLQRFERIGRHALRTLPSLADRVVTLDRQRQALP